MCDRTKEPVCYLVGAGEFGGSGFEPGPRDLVIAADGGYAMLSARGIRTDLLIGDFDSLTERQKEFQGEIRRLPVEKDDTDMRAAFLEGYRAGYRTYLIYGGTGGRRFSHTMANIQLLAEMAEKGACGEMFGAGTWHTVIKDGEINFPAGKTGDLSVFSLDDRSEGVSISGLKYALTDAALTNRFPLGVSNSFTGEPARVAVKRGCLLIVAEAPD